MYDIPRRNVLIWRILLQPTYEQNNKIFILGNVGRVIVLLRKALYSNFKKYDKTAYR